MPILSIFLLHHIQIGHFALLGTTAANAVPKVWYCGEVFPCNFALAHLAREKDHLQSLFLSDCFLNFFLPDLKPPTAPGGNPAIPLPCLLSLLHSCFFLLLTGIFANHHSVCKRSFLPRLFFLIWCASSWQNLEIAKLFCSSFPINGFAIANFRSKRIRFMFAKTIFRCAQENTRYAFRMHCLLMDESIPGRGKFARKRDETMLCTIFNITTEGLVFGLLNHRWPLLQREN